MAAQTHARPGRPKRRAAPTNRRERLIATLESLLDDVPEFKPPPAEYRCRLLEIDDLAILLHDGRALAISPALAREILEELATHG